ncbi:two-component sensor histidine kinase [Clostridium chromiireducens]|uniref:histidine kinase n=1 Tax=Clostridium chromiireducens TaxID=225345 RepID=A0A964W1R0_9CLOT|nr:HAMP domain-containing sensor histidine kinase [Clostridium chromiireducens]MVX63322.1 two-component sensor histidine kinase [Clostridium chromiireducens]
MFQEMCEEEASYIIESKKRCIELGLDPNRPEIPQNIMSELDLGRKKDLYDEVLEVVKFFSNKVIKSLEGTPLIMTITDENGYLLDILGDEIMIKTMSQSGVKPGIQFREEEMGTNVVSLTLKQNKPIQLVGSNHYHKCFHDSACYGVPFHYSSDGNLLGSICIMTAVILHNPFFLMTLTTVVDAIERELLLRKQNRKINRQKELLYESEKRQRELLEKDLVMKDEFITLITHEFKTPINVIYSAIQLIEHVYIKDIPESVKNLIGSIKRNTFRQLRLVNNLLDITKLKSDQFKLNLKNVDLVVMTKLITESIKIYSDQKKINLDFNANVESINTALDDEKYERVILNLLSNAIKFTPEGGSITIQVKADKKDKTIEISVCDTGVGIPKEKHRKIFHRFGQVENNLSRQAEGSGIGLALVKLLVIILEGKIEVESEVGMGSNFIITLPIKEETVEEENCLFPDSDNRLVNAINVEFSDIYF